MEFFKKRGVAIAITAVVIVLMSLVGILTAPVELPEVSVGTWVYDGADVLSPEQESYLIQANADLLSNHAAVIAVATVPDTSGWELLDFAVDLADKWELTGSDFILVLDIEGDNYWLVQGYDLVDLFPDALAGQYLRQFLENNFAAKNYGAGAIELFNALRYWYDSTDVPEYDYNYGYGDEHLGFYDGEPVEESGASGFGSALLLIIVAVLVIVALDGLRYNNYRRRRPSVAYIPLFFGRPRRPRRPAPPPPPPPRPNSGGGFGSFFGSSRPTSGSRPNSSFRPSSSRPSSFTRPTRPSGSGRTSSGSFGGGRTGSFGAGRRSSGGSFGGGRSSGAGRSSGGRRR